MKTTQIRGVKRKHPAEIGIGVSLGLLSVFLLFFSCKQNLEKGKDLDKEMVNTTSAKSSITVTQVMGKDIPSCRSGAWNRSATCKMEIPSRFKFVKSSLANTNDENGKK